MKGGFTTSKWPSVHINFLLLGKSNPLLKKIIKYWFIVLIEIKVAYTINKLRQKTNYLQCNELFAIGCSIMSLVIKGDIQVVNKTIETW
jgi:hypothetical protein